MKLKTLIAVAVAGAFAVPFAAQASADGDRLIVAQAGGSGGAAGGTTTSPSTTHPQGNPAASAPAGAPTRPGSALGSASGGSTATGDMSFSEIDKNNDGQISRAEWDDYHRSRTGAASGSSGASGSSAPDSPSSGGPASTHQNMPGGSTTGKNPR